MEKPQFPLQVHLSRLKTVKQGLEKINLEKGILKLIFLRYPLIGLATSIFSKNHKHNQV